MGFGEWVSNAWTQYIVEPTQNLVSKVPFVGDNVANAMDNGSRENELSISGTKSTIIQVASAAGAYIAADELTKGSGTGIRMIAKIAGAGIAFVASKEIAKDIAAATDYTRENSSDGKSARFSTAEAAFKNIFTKGQEYNGHTVDSDVDNEIAGG